eukprot:818205-Amphidinium_carterae.1
MSCASFATHLFNPMMLHDSLGESRAACQSRAQAHDNTSQFQFGCIARCAFVAPTLPPEVTRALLCAVSGPKRKSSVRPGMACLLLSGHEVIPPGASRLSFGSFMRNMLEPVPPQIWRCPRRPESGTTRTLTKATGSESTRWKRGDSSRASLCAAGAVAAIFRAAEDPSVAACVSPCTHHNRWLPAHAPQLIIVLCGLVEKPEESQPKSTEQSPNLMKASSW